MSAMTARPWSPMRWSTLVIRRSSRRCIKRANRSMLTTIKIPTIPSENGGTIPFPLRSTQARAASAKMNVAENAPSAWKSMRSHANQSTRRGE
jgi:hypothetical protein